MSRGLEMRVHNESVFHLIEKYLHGDVMIPAFQRPYVWTRKNVEDLVDSLVNRYPVGALTFIGAHNMPAMAMQEQHVTMAAQRNYFSHVFERGMQLDFNIVLDGAQRIQTLYKLFVNGDYRLLFNPFDESWKVVTLLISRDLLNGSQFIESGDLETKDQGRALISDAIELYRSMSKKNQLALSNIIDSSLRNA